MAVRKRQPRSEMSAPPWPKRVKDLPATRGMLQLVRGELKADLRGFRTEVRGEFAKVRSEVKTESAALRAEVSRLSVKVEGIGTEVARLGVLFEEQNANNRIVLEGLSGLWHRQERIESRITEEVEHAVANAWARSR